MSSPKAIGGNPQRNNDLIKIQLLFLELVSGKFSYISPVCSVKPVYIIQ